MREENTYRHEESGSWKLPAEFTGNPFSTPENYFDTLKKNILHQVAVENKVGIEESFTQPEAGFFEQQKSQILNQIALEDNHEQADLAGFTREPEGYFEEATERLSDWIALQEHAEAAEKSPWAMPEGYFSAAQKNITRKIASNSDEQPVVKKTKILSLSSPRFMQYMAAACLLFALSIGALYWNTTSEFNYNAEYSLSDIPEDELINYLIQSSDNDDIYYMSQFIESADDHSDHDHAPGVGCLIDDEILEDYINFVQ